MKFTFSWLKDHLDTKLSPEDIQQDLTSLGIEVEEIIDYSKKFEGFVVGFIKAVSKHPDADKLSLCSVDIGNEELLQIVCGAGNVKNGMKVAVALIGAVIPSTEAILKKGKIRGIESQGMLCSASELCLGNTKWHNDGIMDLSDTEAKVGASLAEALGFMDTVIDISITPNRSDCFSVRGIARDLAAYGSGILKPLPVFEFNEIIDDVVNVDIQTVNCKYFSYRIMRNIDILKTPSVIAERLSMIGQKLILGPVNIANYVCIDVGQPLHIFDLDKLPKTINIRDLEANKEIYTLNNETTLTAEGTIAICDGDKPLSLAGIMGGTETACSESTTNILIEGAYFDRISIARAAQKMCLLSDSRTRFERGIDPFGINIGVDFTTSLIASLSLYSSVSMRKAWGELPNNKYHIVLTYQKFKNLTSLGEKEWDEAKNILPRLGIEICELNSDYIKVITPSHRYDLKIEEDVIEEVLRIIGFDKIVEKELPVIPPKIKEYTEDVIADSLIFSGISEVKTFSFIDEETALQFTSKESLVYIDKPQTIDYAVMRPSLIASHIKALKINQSKSQKNSKFFEIGRSFRQKDGEIEQTNTVTLILSERNISIRSWRKKDFDVSVYDVKEILEKLLKLLKVKNFKISKDKTPEYFHPGRSGTVVIQKDTILAHFGELHPTLLKELDVRGPLACFELYLDVLPEIFPVSKKKQQPLSSYQPITRDFSFILDKEVFVGDIITSIEKLHIKEMMSINIFDIYESDSIGDNKKAVSFEVMLQSFVDTLSDENIRDISEKIINIVSTKFGGILRDS